MDCNKCPIKEECEKEELTKHPNYPEPLGCPLLRAARMPKRAITWLIEEAKKSG